MGNHQHLVELNGKKYDAITGSEVASANRSVSTTIVPQQSHHKSIDGVVRVNSKKIAAKAVHTKPAKSKTLMRNAVAKSHVSATAITVNKSIESLSARRALEEQRLGRAKKTPINNRVSRFGISESAATFKIAPQHTTIPVKPAPEHKPAPTNSPIHSHPEPPQAPNHFEAQLEQASAHNEKPVKKPKLHHRAAKKLHVKPSMVSAGLTIGAVVVLGGFIAYQNAAAIGIRVAAARSGVAVSVPGYTPAGFKIKSHDTKPGQITIGYKSNSDGRSFKVTQTVSSWDSNTLLENYVVSNAYQATSSKGRTIYLYNGNNATWVDNGVWYNVEGGTILSSNQLQHLVDSM